MTDIYNDIAKYIANSEEKKVRLKDLWDVFLEGLENPAPIVMGMRNENFKRVIGIFSPTTGNLLLECENLGDIPETCNDEAGNPFEVNDYHIDVWYELNE